MLAGIFAAVIGFSAVFVSFAELQRSATLEIWRDVLRINDIYAEQEIDLADVCLVRVEQAWFSRMLHYGAIEIFTDRGPKPAAVISGVSHPQSFKKKFDMVLKHRDPTTPIA